MGNMSLNWRNVSGLFSTFFPFNLGFAGNLVSIDAAGRNVWGVNRDDEIWRFDWNRDSWEKMPGRAVQVSCSEDGAVWCINRQENIFQWTGSQWEQRPGALRRISVGLSFPSLTFEPDITGSHQHVWGCNNRDEIYYWQNNNWNKSDGACREISVGNDGVVWCVNANEDIWVKRGGPNSNWTQLPGKAVKISAFNSNTVLGLNRQNEVWGPSFLYDFLSDEIQLGVQAVGENYKVQFLWLTSQLVDTNMLGDLTMEVKSITTVHFLFLISSTHMKGTSFGNGPSVTVGMGSTHSVSHSHSVHHHHPPRMSLLCSASLIF